jgi:hypothetical protein
MSARRMATLPPKTDDWRRGLRRETARGRLALWVAEPGFLIFQLVAHGDKSFVEPIVMGFQRSLDHLRPVQMFVDAELMTSYDSELRTEVTAALLEQRSSIESLHIVVRSKIVAMGVSVANLALGGLMTIYKEPDRFLEALRAHTARSNVSSFSARSFARERLARAR